MPPEFGCLIDGRHGWHTHRMMIELAKDLGFPLAEEVWVRVVDYDHGDHDNTDSIEIVFSVMDEAEAWLNEHVAGEDAEFGWHDGDFFYQPTEWWEEE